MSAPTILYTLASAPMFASRPFLAAFLTALLARWGVAFEWIADNETVQALHAAPAWFQSTITIVILGALAIAEAVSAKNADVRAVLDEVDSYLKTAIAFVVALAIVDDESAKTLHGIQRSGLGLETAWSALVASCTYAVAQLRRAAFAYFAEIDDDDDIGLQSVLAWIEGSWTLLAILFLAVFPIVALTLSALSALGLYQFRRWTLKREEQAKVPCANCSAPIYPHATRCSACRVAVVAPRQVGVFGQPRAEPTDDVVRQRSDLIARKRCPLCATRLTKRAVRQPCASCGTVTFGSQIELERYLRDLRARMPKTLLVCFALSAIPVLGVIPGVIYYRLSVVSGLRGYVPPLRGCLARVMIRVIQWGIIAFQPIPAFGALVVPIMCLSSYAIYRHALVGRAEDELAAGALAAPEA
ncbi:MAG: hypothetical protein ACKVWV_13245 [Planctomycetota bacterium]